MRLQPVFTVNVDSQTSGSFVDVCMTRHSLYPLVELGMTHLYLRIPVGNWKSHRFVRYASLGVQQNVNLLK